MGLQPHCKEGQRRDCHQQGRSDEIFQVHITQLVQEGRSHLVSGLGLGPRGLKEEAKEFFTLATY